MENHKAYGLITTITMIVGIVIGSGIFFRADDVLLYSNGNLLLGMMILCLGALCIIFGSLTLSRLSAQCSSSGGIVAYFEKFVSPKMAAGFGWFQLFVYLPTIMMVVGWAGAIYTFMLLGIDASLEVQVLLSAFYCTFFLVVNTLSRSLGGYLQNIATIVKLLPLILIALAGFFFSQPLTPSEIGQTTFHTELSKWTWLSALVPLAYSYDGWTIALNIAPEVKNPKKNMTRALILSPIFILVVYLLYSYGLSALLGPQKVLELGDESIFAAGVMLLGQRLGNLLMVTIVISVLGVLNGIALGAIRLPQALAEKKMIPECGGLSTISPRLGVSVRSAFLFWGVTLFWGIVHYLVMKFNLFNGHDVSEISIVFNYLCYLILYWVVFKMKSETNKRFANQVLSVLAILGSLMIFIGSLINEPVNISLFVCFCLLVTLIGTQFYRKTRLK